MKRTYPEYEVPPVLVTVRKSLRGSVGRGHLARRAVEAWDDLGEVAKHAVVRGVLCFDPLAVSKILLLNC